MLFRGELRVLMNIPSERHHLCVRGVGDPSYAIDHLFSEHHPKEKGHGPLPRPSRLETDESVETGPGDLRSLILVSELPGGAEVEARDLLHTLVIHFMRFIANAVVVFVRPREVEDKRDVVLGEVPVIRAAVELVRVIRCVETVT